jgi:hypothetical protein
MLPRTSHDAATDDDDIRQRRAWLHARSAGIGTTRRPTPAARIMVGSIS